MLYETDIAFERETSLNLLVDDIVPRDLCSHNVHGLPIWK